MNHKNIFLIHLIITLFLTSSAWFIQLIYYPFIFKLVSNIHTFNTLFGDYFNTELLCLIYYLAIPFTLELLTGLLLFKTKKKNKTPLLIKLSFILIICIWGTIGIVQLPLLLILRKGYHIVAFKTLMISSWLLITLWTIRSCGLLITLWKHLPSNKEKET